MEPIQGDIVAAEDGPGFTVRWPHGGTHLAVGPLPSLEDARLACDALAVKEALDQGLPLESLADLPLYCPNAFRLDVLEGARPVMDAVRIKDLAAQLPFLTHRASQHSGVSGLTNGLLLPEQQATARAVQLALLVGCMAAFVANARGDPDRCLASMRREPTGAPVMYRLLTSNETLRKLAHCTSLAPLLSACSAHQFLVRLLQAAPQACLAAVDEEMGWTVLHWAVLTGDTQAVAAIVEAVPAAVHTIDTDGNSLLLLACKAGHAAAVRLLLRAAPETAMLPGNGGRQRPLEAALARNNPEVVAALLECEPSLVDLEDQFGMLPHHSAAFCGRAEALRALLDAAPNAAGARLADGLTALHYAAQGGQTACIDVLLAAEPRLARMPCTMRGELPLHAAAFFGHTAAVRQLLLAAPDTADARTGKGFNALHLACCMDRACAAEALLSQAPHLAFTVTSEEQHTAMHLAALHGSQPACLDLLCRVAPHLALQRDNKGATPLLLAADLGSADMVALLLAAAPDSLDLGDDEGILPLHMAAAAGHAGVLRLLLAAAPDLADAMTLNGITALHMAAMCGQEECAQLLLSIGGRHLALLRGEGDSGVPLHIAAAANQVGAMRLLLAAAPDCATAVDAGGKTALGRVLSLPGALQPGGSEEQPECTDAVRCLLGAGPGVTVLAALVAAGADAQPFFADFVLQRQPLSAEEWAAVPASCPGLRHALPAVLERSVQQAAQLVRHLPAHEAARLRCGALCLAWAQRRSRVFLPLPLVWRLLGLSLVD